MRETSPEFPLRDMLAAIRHIERKLADIWSLSKETSMFQAALSFAVHVVVGQTGNPATRHDFLEYHAKTLRRHCIRG